MVKKARPKAARKVKVKTQMMRRQVVVEHIVATAQPAPMANIFGIQNDGTEFRFLFFQARPPFINPAAPDAVERFKSLNSIPAICVADVAMSASRIPEVIKILTDNFRKFEEQQAQQQAPVSDERKHE